MLPLETALLLPRTGTRTDSRYLGIRADCLESLRELVDVAADVDWLQGVWQFHFFECDRDFLPCAPEQ